jgi:hypothetical protein
MRTRLSHLVTALAIALSALLPAPFAASAATTSIKPSIEIDGNGYWASSAVDAAGAVHAVFVRWGRPGVWYATNKSGSFVTTRVTTAPPSGRPVIGVDGAGHAYIVFANQSASPGIRFATDRSGTWQTTRLTTGAIDLDPAIAVHPSGEVHVVFTSDNDVVYLTNRRGYWTRLTAVPSAAHPAIALDSTRRVHMAYEQGTAIGYRTDATGAWVSSTVAAHGTAPAIAVAGTSPRIAYAVSNDNASGGLFYATRAGTVWTSTPVRAGYLAESHPAIVLDSAGTAYLAYEGTGSQGNTVEYATNSTGSWVRAPIAVGNYPSIGLGTGAARLITYSGSAVYLRSSAAPPWSGQVVSSSAYDMQPDIAMGSDDVPRIVYRVQYPDPGLRFGTWNGAAFVTARITFADDRSPALAIDPAGHAHVAFIRAGTTELWYGTNATGSWTFKEVDATDTLDCPAIAIGPSGAVHLAAFREHSENGFFYPRVAWYHETAGTWSMLEDLPIVSFPGCPGLAVDATGAPHLVYENGTNLTEAARSGSVWTSVTFGQVGDRLPQIAFAADGTTVISFGRTNGYDVPDGGLYVRTDATGAFETSQVGKTADIDQRHGLALDGAGGIHLAYRGYVWDVGLHVATNAGGAWQAARLLDGDVGGPAIAVTAAGKSHVATVGALTSGGSAGTIHLWD